MSNAPDAFDDRVAEKIATAMFLEICQRHSGKPGSEHWMMPRQLPPNYQNSQSILSSCGAYLYNGAIGICLSLAAYFKVSNQEIAMRLALSGLQPLRRTIDSVSHRKRIQHSERIRIGGLFGLGSLIYGLTQIGLLLDRSDLISEAHLLTDLITSDYIERENRFDLASGCAGTILGLLTVQQERPEINRYGLTPLDLANQYAATLTGNFEQDWFSVERTLVQKLGIPRMGLAHGMTGILLSLFRLYEQTKSEKILSLVLAGMHCERQHLSRIFSSNGFQNVPPTWCHGIPGIALACTEYYRICRNETTEDYLFALKSALLKIPMLALDHLCCGNMGVVEALAAMSQALGSEELMEASRRRAWWTLRRAKTVGCFSFFYPRDISLFVPSLFYGTSGVGLTLLRLCRGEQLPCVLLMN